MTCTLDGKQLKERNFLLYPICRLCTTMKLLVLTMHKAVKEIHWDYSIESRHKQFLFTSCDASKKRMSECSKGVRFFVVASHWVKKNRSSTNHGMMFYFRHVYAELFFTSQYKDWRWTTVKKHHSSNQKYKWKYFTV